MRKVRGAQSGAHNSPISTGPWSLSRDFFSFVLPVLVCCLHCRRLLGRHRAGLLSHCGNRLPWHWHIRRGELIFKGRVGGETRCRAERIVRSLGTKALLSVAALSSYRLGYALKHGADALNAEWCAQLSSFCLKGQNSKSSILSTIENPQVRWAEAKYNIPISNSPSLSEKMFFFFFFFLGFLTGWADASPRPPRVRWDRPSFRATLSASISLNSKAAKASS